MDLAKIERIWTGEYECGPGRSASGDRTVNEMIQKGWVLITSKIVQCGNSRDGFYAQNCVVLGKPKPRRKSFLQITSGSSEAKREAFTGNSNL